MNNESYLFSLIGGILILLGSLTIFGCGIGGCGIGYMGSMMNYMMGGFGLLGFLSYMSLIGIVSGLVIIYGAFMIKNKPKETRTWGTLILIFSHKLVKHGRISNWSYSWDNWRNICLI